jgi:hypothetical protein
METTGRRQQPQRNGPESGESGCSLSSLPCIAERVCPRVCCHVDNADIAKREREDAGRTGVLSPSSSVASAE